MMLQKSESLAIDPQSFDALAELAYRESGLQLVAEKTSMIQSRLRHRLKASGIESFREYAQYVCSDSGVRERKHMISALTTNVSHFFRERHHFEILSKKILPKLMASAGEDAPVRIWSAGCSNGQEAFSIAMTILEDYPNANELNVKILATDIDPQVIAFATAAEYPERLVAGIPSELVSKYFLAGASGEEENFVAKNCLRSLVHFKELNLLSDWPMKRQMNVIFCRNVVIYFDQETQNRLWPKFRQQMCNDSHLFLGHSERIPDPARFGFTNDGPTSYTPSQAAIT